MPAARFSSSQAHSFSGSGESKLLNGRSGTVSLRKITLRWRLLPSMVLLHS